MAHFHISTTCGAFNGAHQLIALWPPSEFVVGDPYVLRVLPKLGILCTSDQLRSTIVVDTPAPMY